MQQTTETQSMIKSNTYTIPYDVATINALNGVIFYGYHQDPNHSLGAQIWNALSQLESQDFIDYRLPDTWLDALSAVPKTTGSTKVHFKFPTTEAFYHQIAGKFADPSFEHTFDELVQELLNQILNLNDVLDENKPRLEIHFNNSEQQILTLLRHQDVYHFYDILDNLEAGD